MSMSIDLTGLEEARGLFEKDFDSVLEEFVDESALEIEEQGIKNIDDRVYSQPESETYVRTGALGRGHRIDQKSDSRVIKFDSRIGGADRAYTPFTNRNRRISRLNTGWFDDLVVESTIKFREFIKTILK